MKERTAFSVPRRNGGFTLLEVLISLVLLSIILGAIYSTFFLSDRAIEGMDESLLRLRESRMAVDAMAREIESIPQLSRQDNPGPAFKVEDRDLYGKEASRFSFRSFSPLLPGLSSITYYVKEKDGKQSLFKKIVPAYKPEVPGQEGAEMIEDIGSFTVEVRNDNDWVKTWDAAETGKIPEEIRFTITVKIKDRTVTLYESCSPKTGKVM